MKKKLQIFVSSTFNDLKKERQNVIEAILEMGYIPAGMEYFIGDDEQQFEIIKKWIKESDAYILLVGGCYGTINRFDDKGRSYTHLEYEYAQRIKKPIRILRLSTNYIKQKKNDGDYTESDLTDPKMKQFRNNLPLCNNADSLSEIKSVTKTLLGSLQRLERKESCGWVKAIDISPLIRLHPNNVSLAKSKSIKGQYYIYYYSTEKKKNIQSVLILDIRNNSMVAWLKNDINKKGKPTYEYSGKFEIFDDFLYLELKSKVDNEKVFSVIKLLPGKLSSSIGIIVAQGMSKQAVAATFIITKDIITNQDVFEEFRQDQLCQFNDSERLMIDDEAIKHLRENIAEYNSGEDWFSD